MATPITSPAFNEGDIVHLRVRVIEDGGAAVRVLCEQPGLRQTFWAPRTSIVLRGRDRGKACPGRDPGQDPVLGENRRLEEAGQGSDAAPRDDEHA